MAATIDDTMSGENSNSYVSLAWADDYATNRRLYSSSWSAATSDTKTAALLQATSLLDVSFDWAGAPSYSVQKLRWPRVGVYNMDYELISGGELPDNLKKSQVDLAIALLESNRTAQPANLGLGFSSASLGPLSVTLDGDRVDSLIPDFIVSRLSIYGNYRFTKGVGIANLLRG